MFTVERGDVVGDMLNDVEFCALVVGDLVVSATTDGDLVFSATTWRIFSLGYTRQYAQKN